MDSDQLSTQLIAGLLLRCCWEQRKQGSAQILWEVLFAAWTSRTLQDLQARVGGPVHLGVSEAICAGVESVHGRNSTGAQMPLVQFCRMLVGGVCWQRMLKPQI